MEKDLRRMAGAERLLEADDLEHTTAPVTFICARVREGFQAVLAHHRYRASAGYGDHTDPAGGATNDGRSVGKGSHVAFAGPKSS